MKSEMAMKLKALLDNMSQEEFDKKWETIQEMGFQGPSADEVLEYYSSILDTTVSYVVIDEGMLQSCYNAGESNYAMAA